MHVNENKPFIKHSSGDSIKFMQWGVASPSDEHPVFNTLNPRQYPSN